MSYVVYSKPACPACDNAKALLKAKGAQYEEFIMDVGQPKSIGTNYYTIDQLKQLVPTARTVPQIFKKRGNDYELVGGYDALQLKLR